MSMCAAYGGAPVSRCLIAKKGLERQSNYFAVAEPLAF